MSLSKFYYGYTITSSNSILNFNEGAGELSATITIGSYTPTDFATAIQTALNAAGGLTYTATFNRSTRVITIAAGSSFSLLVTTGSQVALSPWAIMGFTADKTSASSHAGDAASGSEYVVQYEMQDYVPSARWTQSANATINKTASGRVEVVRFGSESFMQGNMKYITNIAQPSVGPITNNASGVANFIEFMDYAITKGPLEFIADKDAPNTFEKMILESTPENRDGVGYKIKELYDLNLPQYFESGTLTFRVVI